MKPRIRFKMGCWWCYSRNPDIFGIGYSPLMAYEKWRDKEICSS